MVPFHGWEMPLHYGSQVQEHHAVRRACGLFDVSHMCIVDLAGAGTLDFLRHLTANDPARLRDGQCQYGVLCNEQGGVVDDIIVTRLGGERFRVVSNSATRDKVLAWQERWRPSFRVDFTPRPDLAMVAIQGPGALAVTDRVLPLAARPRVGALRPFHALEEGGWMVSRTGYTGEDGLEIQLPAAGVAALWRQLTGEGAQPAGLGARDTLRLEAGMSLYGSDLDDGHNPLDCGLGWTIAWDPPERDFVGRAALEARRGAAAGVRRIGLLLEGKGVLRDGQTVSLEGRTVGAITSGSYSPTLEQGIALARVSESVPAGGAWTVEIRGRHHPVRVVRPPFVRNGQRAWRDE